VSVLNLIKKLHKTVAKLYRVRPIDFQDFQDGKNARTRPKLILIFKLMKFHWPVGSGRPK